jgi:hypothetical protein
MSPWPIKMEPDAYFWINEPRESEKLGAWTRKGTISGLEMHVPNLKQRNGLKTHPKKNRPIKSGLRCSAFRSIWENFEVVGGLELDFFFSENKRTQSCAVILNFISDIRMNIVHFISHIHIFNFDKWYFWKHQLQWTTRLCQSFIVVRPIQSDPPPPLMQLRIKIRCFIGLRCKKAEKLLGF